MSGTTIWQRHKPTDAMDAPRELTSAPGERLARLRAGTTGAVLPLGVQIVARPWHDHVALAAAACVEAALGPAAAAPGR